MKPLDGAVLREQVEALLWGFLRDMEGVPLRRSRHNDLPSVSALSEVENTAARILALIKGVPRPIRDACGSCRDLSACADEGRCLNYVTPLIVQGDDALRPGTWTFKPEQEGRLRAAGVHVATRPLARSDRKRVKPLTLWERFVLRWLR